MWLAGRIMAVIYMNSISKSRLEETLLWHSSMSPSKVGQRDREGRSWWGFRQSSSESDAQDTACRFCRLPCLCCIDVSSFLFKCHFLPCVSTSFFIFTAPLVNRSSRCSATSLNQNTFSNNSSWNICFKCIRTRILIYLFWLVWFISFSGLVYFCCLL